MSNQRYKKSERSEFLSDNPLIIQDTDKESLLTDVNIARRMIPIIDEITDCTFEQVKNLYDELIEQSNTQPIHVIVGSPGGDVRSMLGIMNLFLLSRAPIYTYIFGETFSAGSWIFLCGQRRFAPKTTLNTIMFHPMEFTRDDNVGNHISHLEYIKKLNTNLIKFTSEKTSIKVETLQKLTSSETYYFVGDEIFDNQLATDVLDSSDFWLSEKSSKKKAKRSLITD